MVLMAANASGIMQETKIVIKGWEGCIQIYADDLTSLLPHYLLLAHTEKIRVPWTNGVTI